MAVINRTSLVRGPALCTYLSPNDGTTTVKINVKEDFEIKDIVETMEIGTSAAAHVDERAIEAYSEATITPTGIWTTALLNAIYTPFANYKRGFSLLNSLNATPADLPFIANAVDGEIHTIGSAAITKVPDLFLSAKKTMIGSMTVKGFRKKGTGWNDATSLRAIAATGGTGADSTFSPASIIVQPYSATWGSVSGFSGFDTQDGWTIQFAIKTNEIETDSQGKIDIAFDSISVMAKCVPIGPTSSQILAAMKFQGLTLPNGRGQSLQSDGAGGTTPDLVISGVNDAGATAITLTAAQLKTSTDAFSPFKLRAGEIGFVATRKFSAGLPQALFSMAAAA